VITSISRTACTKLVITQVALDSIGDARRTMAKMERQADKKVLPKRALKRIWACELQVAWFCSAATTPEKPANAIASSRRLGKTSTGLNEKPHHQIRFCYAMSNELKFAVSPMIAQTAENRT
jgi:hypothetical protein